LSQLASYRCSCLIPAGIFTPNSSFLGADRVTSIFIELKINNIEELHKMPVSPQDFALWASVTGNNYPETASERMALAPQVHNFVRNFGKSGANRVLEQPGSNAVYNQPVSAQHLNANSVFGSPITPDNNVSKIVGTYDSTLTGEHTANQEAERIEDTSKQYNLVRNIGRAALGAGLVAGGVALAATPEGRQTVQNAATTVKQGAQNISNRVSSFLGGLGAGRGIDPDTIRNSGDVTPPTTAQRYNQADVPVATQEAQVAKGSPVGSLIPGDKGYEDRLLNIIYQQELEARPPALTKEDMERNIKRNAVLSTKPVTESEVITSSQTFSPSQTGDIVALNQRREAASRLANVARKLKSGMSFSDIKYGVETTDPPLPNLPGLEQQGLSERIRSLSSVELPEAMPATTSQQTSSLNPSLTDEVDLFVAGLTKNADPWTGEYTPASKSTESFNVPLQTIKGKVPDPWYARGPRPVRTASPEELKAANLVAEVYAKTGERITLENAQAALLGGELSSAVQKAFTPTDYLAIGPQTFEPGQVQTGRAMQVGTGEIRGATSKDFLERFTEENVAGLTKQGRQSASRATLGGDYVPGASQEITDPNAVIATAGGRTMRNVSALDKEALAEGRIEYAGFTGQTTDVNPEVAAATYKSATNPQKVRMFNSLLSPQSSSQVLHLKTESGIIPMTTNEFRKRTGAQAHKVFADVVQQHAAHHGIELPNPDIITNSGQVIENTNPAFIEAANRLINTKGIRESVYPMMAAKFNDVLQQSGINLTAAKDPDLSHGALNTLMGVARNTSTAQIGLENFGKLAGRSRSRGIVRSDTSQIPVSIPGPSAESISQAMKGLGLGTKLNPY